MAGIYIHIPFCKQACHYCDFHFSTSFQYKDELLQAISAELILQKNYLLGEKIETIYFGGGTPSLLSADEINALIEQLTKIHQVAANAEITLEVNPDDLDNIKLRALRQTPVNRFSIGAQSFFDEDLLWMNRAHNSSEAMASIQRAQDVGFENLTADLIYGYPLLTDTKWKSNLEHIFELQIPHLSAYSMTVEPQTALASFIRKKKQAAMSEEQSATQFIMLMDAMQLRGFEHYEISNFCKPGHYSRHNTNYWKGVKYLGIGPSAHSFNGESRQWNIANNNKYMQSIYRHQLPAETEQLTEANRLNEYTMTALRTMWGIDLQYLSNMSPGAGDILQKQAKQFFEKTWIMQNDDKITLTQQGKLYADHIAAELFF